MEGNKIKAQERTSSGALEIDHIATQDIENLVRQINDAEREVENLHKQLSPIVLSVENDFSRVSSLKRQLKHQIGPIYSRIVDADRRKRRRMDEEHHRRY